MPLIAATALTPVLFFDLGSPYAYLASERADRVLGSAPGLAPVLLGAIFQKRGFGSWAPTAARSLRSAEIEQRAERYGLPPIVWPAQWPSNGLTAMRCATWVDRGGGVRTFARALFRAQFAEGRDIADPAVLRAAAEQSALDPEAMLRGAGEPAVKQALRNLTQQAWEAGVRGVPSVRVGDAIFFGDDQLELAAEAAAAAR
ncbi:MAG: DsbA family protein [Solirubrobacteraceae bacterium]